MTLSTLQGSQRLQSTASRVYPVPISVQAAARPGDAKHYKLTAQHACAAIATRSSAYWGFACTASHAVFGHAFYGPILDGVTEQAKQMGYHRCWASPEDEQRLFRAEKTALNFEAVHRDSMRRDSRNALFRMNAEAFQRRGTPVILMNVKFGKAHRFVIDDNTAA